MGMDFQFFPHIAGTKYKWWMDGDPVDQGAPFYSGLRPQELPSPKKIRRNGLNCAGFVNVMMLANNLRFPIAEAGTDGWFEYLSSHGVLKTLDRAQSYERGSLLLRNYTSPQDQGHLALVCFQMPLQSTFIAHCRSAHQMARGLTGPGVILEKFEYSDMWHSNGTYTHVCEWSYLQRLGKDTPKMPQIELSTPVPIKHTHITTGNMNTRRDTSGRITMGTPLWIQQPWLDEVLTGRKTIEGRVLGTDRKSKWKEGDVVMVGQNAEDHDAQQAIVTKVRHYSTLYEFLKNEWKMAAPQCSTMAEATAAYKAVMTTSKGLTQDGVNKGQSISAFDPRRIVARGGLVAVEFQLP